MNKDILSAVKMMLIVLVVAIFLFLLFVDGGRLNIIVDLVFTPLLWVFTFPIVGPVIFIITGIVTYGIFTLRPSPNWKKNEKSIFTLTLLLVVGGFLVSAEHAGLMFILTCLIGVSYPIIQIIRIEVKQAKSIIKILS